MSGTGHPTSERVGTLRKHGREAVRRVEAHRSIPPWMGSSIASVAIMSAM